MDSDQYFLIQVYLCWDQCIESLRRSLNISAVKIPLDTKKLEVFGTMVNSCAEQIHIYNIANNTAIVVSEKVTVAGFDVDPEIPRRKSFA